MAAGLDAATLAGHGYLRSGETAPSPPQRTSRYTAQALVLDRPTRSLLDQRKSVVRPLFARLITVWHPCTGHPMRGAQCSASHPLALATSTSSGKATRTTSPDFMARCRDKDPNLFTTSEKKKALYSLYRRARHLDNKWAIACSKPDGFTLLGMIPVFGGAMSTMLAIGYLRQMRDTFTIPKEVGDEMKNNIALHVVISILPMVGWILRRIFGVNKRNYKLLERYVMSEASYSEAGSESSKSIE
ncbi:hypothetical protein H4R24_005014 [Coemansia sp. RSA 988]|nr:hypothetical protein H4R24_005014 [Coemansia sp. RSA 988]